MVAEGGVGPEVVVREAPLLAEYLRLEQRVEALTVEALVPELAVKRLDGAILPGAARLDEERLHAHALEPVRHRLGGELGAVVRADVGGSRRATTIARHARMYAATTTRCFSARPAAVRSKTKS